MSELTKITVVGETRRVTLVIPADEPFGAHVPEIARLLGRPAANAVLTTAYGEQIDLAHAPDDQGVLDGAVLRLLEAAQLPAPPEVTDVTDRVAELRDDARGAWNEAHRLVAGAVGLGALSAGAGIALSALAGGWTTVVLVGLTTIAATIAGRVRRDALGLLLLGAALGATLPTAMWLAGLFPGDKVPGAGVAAVLVGLAWVVLAAVVGLGSRSLGAALGAAVGILLTAAVAVLPLVGVDPTGTAAVVAALGILALGLLPALAVAASGLASLDDEVIAGALPGRDRVATSLAESFRITAWAVAAVAVWLAPALAVLLGSGELWPMLVGAAVAVTAMLRTRVVPMAVPRWMLWVAALGGTVAGIGIAPTVPDAARLALAIAGAIMLSVLVLARPSVQGRIRARRAGDLLETLATVAIVPFVIGAFGVYDVLLGVFA